MKVLLLGSTGAVGRPLVGMLAGRGHEVLGTTRSVAKAEALRALGAEPIILDARDLAALRRVVLTAAPDAIINQLTDLSGPLNPRKYGEWLESTNQLRVETTSALARAGAEAGVRRLISQSVAFAYRWDGEGLKTEDDPLFDRGPSGFDRAVAALHQLEGQTLGTPGIEGVVLRYGYFYGPGTPYARDGQVALMVRRRQFPVIGPGTGRFSFVHIEDAAGAALTALEGGLPGTYNIVDDDPAELREWLPAYARALGARSPRHVPRWLARIAAGRFMADGCVELRGASNDKARLELAWKPRWPGWREGFARTLA